MVLPRKLKLLIFMTAVTLVFKIILYYSMTVIQLVTQESIRMLHTFILICGILCVQHGKLDCFPISSRKYIYLVIFILNYDNK